jgi:dTDP-4-dehydrorhamnose reductase
LDRWFIIRTSWLFGEFGNNFVNTILQNAKIGNELRVVDDQIGSPTYCVDLVKQINILIDTEKYGIYNITNNGSCSWYEFACEVVRIAGYPVNVTPITTEELNRPAPRPHNSMLAHNRLRDAVGDSMPQWQDALKRYIEKVLI